jgi:dihydroorotase
VFKVNPPLRTSTDIEALRAGLADGTIDCVATDHAPHAAEDKETEWGAALPGMLGLQTALSVVIETMLPALGWRGIADRMSVAPAAIGGRADHGQPIEVGTPANLVLVDPDASWTVTPSALASKSRNTPYAGRTLPGKVVATMLRGRLTVLNGEVLNGVSA